MKIGVLTGGGDCPGLNAVIRAIVRTVHNAGGQSIGMLEGWRGAIEGKYLELHPRDTDGIIDRGGTILGSSRTNPYKNDQDVDKLLDRCLQFLASRVRDGVGVEILGPPAADAAAGADERTPAGEAGEPITHHVRAALQTACRMSEPKKKAA